MAIIVPEVFADAVNAKLDTTLRIARVAFDATPLVGDISSYGNKVNFPTFNRIADAAEVVKGTELVPDVFDMTGNEAIIKQVGKSTRVYDVDAKQIKGQTIDNMIAQLAEVMQKKVDGDLVASMDSEVIYKSPAAIADKITSAELQTGIDLFGDDVDTDSFAAIIINSKVRSSFAGMDEFVNTAKTFQTNGNGLTLNGIIGYYYGIPVIVCNNGTYDSGTLEAKTYIVKKNALGYVFQKNISVEEERKPKLFCTDITAGTLYATKLIAPKGLVVVRRTVV